MSTMDIEPQRLPSQVCSFLFICAFWILAADEELSSEEQVFLQEQFGPQTHHRLSSCLKLQGDAFLREFDRRWKRLSDSDLNRFLPGLEDWMQRCATIDGTNPDPEEQVIEKIRQRLALPDQLTRLATQQQHQDRNKTLQPVLRKVHDDEITVLCPLTNHLLLTGSTDRTLKISRPDNDIPHAVFTAHQHPVTAAAVIAGPDRVISADRNGVVFCWASDTQEAAWQQSLSKTGGISAIVTDSSNGVAILATMSRRLIELDLKTGKTVTTLHQPSWCAFRALAFHPGKGLLAVAGDDRSIHLVDRSGNEQAILTGHAGVIQDLAFSADGQHLASVARDNMVRIWNLEQPEQHACLAGHRFSAYGVDLSDDGQYVLSASWDHTLRLWQRETGAARHTIEHPAARFNTCAFFGTLIVGGGSDGSLCICNIQALI